MVKQPNHFPKEPESLPLPSDEALDSLFVLIIEFVVLVVIFLVMRALSLSQLS